jgi:hypothetical protein
VVCKSVTNVTNSIKNTIPNFCSLVKIMGMTEDDDITENAITLVFSRTGKSFNQKVLEPEDNITGKRYNLKMI